MSDTHNHERSGLGGIYFVLGAVVVALGIVLWLMMAPGDESATTAPAESDASSTSVTIENSDSAAPADSSGATASGDAAASDTAASDSGSTDTSGAAAEATTQSGGSN
ncbi:hypothetical protein B6V73_10035 [Thioclava sp. JM3]|uniref:hypothetical protein n=1 Tax=Thioclava sp. JM3 TaxID=1973004 RepID=UPI000B546FA2|nr:hypothetical protein [Thioclava sp. JM3]OWY16358.1 hypothetical protein B6V73_10035 [Thioclava sp. JM3]